MVAVHIVDRFARLGATLCGLALAGLLYLLISNRVVLYVLIWGRISLNWGLILVVGFFTVLLFVLTWVLWSMARAVLVIGQSDVTRTGAFGWSVPRTHATDLAMVETANVFRFQMQITDDAARTSSLGRAVSLRRTAGDPGHRLVLVAVEPRDVPTLHHYLTTRPDAPIR